nr:helix-turn-helix transcriptional regulator [uncultured Desulfobulbus sp.]
MNNNSGSVDINGEKIRQAREELGLTQLYLATVVGVTTDTISRWENRRYPSIKLENAKKLAEALELPLEELQETLEENSEPQNQDPPPKTLASSSWLSRRKLLGLTALLVSCIGLGVGLFFFYAQTPLTARRIMPAQTAPNLSFPVIVELSGPVQFRKSMLIREEVQGQLSTYSVLEDDTHKPFGHSPRWIGRLRRGKAHFIYVVTPEKNLSPGQVLTFSGNVMSSEGQLLADPIEGTQTIQIGLYHWADTNRDYAISDDEILSAYETFAPRRSPSISFSALEQLWLAGSYTWNTRKQIFEPIQLKEKE